MAGHSEVGREEPKFPLDGIDGWSYYLSNTPRRAERSMAHKEAEMDHDIGGLEGRLREFEGILGQLVGTDWVNELLGGVRRWIRGGEGWSRSRRGGVTDG